MLRQDDESAEGRGVKPLLQFGNDGVEWGMGFYATRILFMLAVMPESQSASETPGAR